MFHLLRRENNQMSFIGIRGRGENRQEDQKNSMSSVLHIKKFPVFTFFFFLIDPAFVLK